MKTKMRLESLMPKLAQEMQDSISESLQKLELTPETALVKRVFGLEQKAESDGEAHQRIKILASTRELDRDNEIIFPKGMDISQFKENPKILNGHDFSKDFLAKAIKVSRTDFGIPMTIEFAPTEEGEKYRMLSQFMPLTFSVGFIPTEVITPRDAGFGDIVKRLGAEWDEFKKNKSGDKVAAFIKKSLLLETSIVNIPCNAGAVQLAAAKAIKDGLLDEKSAEMVIKSFDIKTEPAPVTVKRVIAAAKRVPRASKHQPISAKRVYAPMTNNEKAEKIAIEVKNSIALQTGRV